jgi:hypothetical protein
MSNKTGRWSRIKSPQYMKVGCGSVFQGRGAQIFEKPRTLLKIPVARKMK